jgi:hypothetical protein
MRLCSETLRQRCRQSRLSNTRLTGDQNRMAFATLFSRPAPQQQFKFFFPPNERAATPECLGEFADRAKHFQPVPECNSEVFKMLIG